MANTLGTLNGELIAQRALRTLLARFPLIRQITTDFSTEVVKFNQTVTSHVVTAGTADDYDTTNGYVPADRTQTDVSVTMDKHKHHTYKINDQERTSTAINLIERFAATAAHALGKQIVDDLLALILAATYTNGSTIAAAAFDRDSLVDIDKVLTDRNVMEDERFMVLATDYYANLKKDTRVISRDFLADNDTVRTGKVTEIENFMVSRYSALPANGENLRGIAGVPESLVLTTRLPEPPDVRDGGEMNVIIEPNTGLAVLQRQFYNWRLGQEERTLTLMYGVAAGVTDNLQRIVTP